MKTLIISSSLSPTSHSYELCRAIEAELKSLGLTPEFLDLREYELNHTHKPETADTEKLRNKVAEADNYIFGMAVHTYTINDHLKTAIELAFTKDQKHRMFGIACAAGSEKSYMALSDLSRILMQEFQMIPLPRAVFVSGGKEADSERIKKFAQGFLELGKKLL